MRRSHLSHQALVHPPRSDLHSEMPATLASLPTEIHAKIASMCALQGRMPEGCILRNQHPVVSDHGSAPREKVADRRCAFGRLKTLEQSGRAVLILGALSRRRSRVDFASA